MRRKTSFILINKDEVVYITAGKTNKNRHCIHDFQYLNLPEGTIKDGIPENEQILTEHLKYIRERAREVGGKIQVVLPDEAVNSKFMRLPALAKRELAEYVNVEAERLAGFASDEGSVDYSVLSRKNDYLNLHLAAVKKEVLQSYQKIHWQVFNGCHGITFRGDVIWPLVFHISAGETIMLLENYQRRGFITVGKRGRILLYRPWSSTGKLNQDVVDVAREADSFLSQELNEDSARKIYCWLTDKHDIKLPELNAGYSWKMLSPDQFKFVENENWHRFISSASTSVLPAVGMMLREI